MSGLQTDNLTVGYGSPLVKEISLCVRPGRVLTLIGPNGCGKSTILKSVTRQLKIMGGSIFLGGQAMETMKEAEIAKKLAMVMTEHIRPELMTCRDIVATGRYPYTGRLGILTEADWQKVEEAIVFVHAEDVAVQDFNKVSDGQRQRIMLARAICQETEILVLDEPTSYLDIRYKLDILSGIRRLAREKNVAVIMSLHEIDLAEKISDKVICVSGETIFAYGTPEMIFKEETIRSLYHIDNGYFDPVFGSIEPPRPEGKPPMFVLSAGGSGIEVYRRLQKENIPFIAGILYPGDIDYQLARVLAMEVITEKPYCRMTEETYAWAAERMQTCEKVIFAGAEAGDMNQALFRLKEEAEKAGKLIEYQTSDRD